MVAGDRRRPAASSSTATVMGSPPNRTTDRARRSTSAGASPSGLRSAIAPRVGDQAIASPRRCAGRGLVGQTLGPRPEQARARSTLGTRTRAKARGASNSSSDSFRTSPAARRSAVRERAREAQRVHGSEPARHVVARPGDVAGHREHRLAVYGRLLAVTSGVTTTLWDPEWQAKRPADEGGPRGGQRSGGFDLRCCFSSRSRRAAERHLGGRV
jgi:hypothetical protein